MIAYTVAPIRVHVSQPAPIRRSAMSGDDIAGEVYALCARVEQLRDSIDHARMTAAQATPLEQRALDLARRGLAIRRRRERVLGPGLFSEPVWDILLELYIARAEGVDVPVGNACLAASVPMTSALRWCQMLQDRRIIYRERDPADGRRVFLRISDDSFAKLTVLLADNAAAGVASADGVKTFPIQRI